MLDQTNKELLSQIFKSSIQLFKQLWITYLSPRKRIVKRIAIYIFHMFVISCLFIAILYPILANNPDTVELSNNFLILAKGFISESNGSAPFWNALGAIGSILAGTGTFGLLWFGWKTALSWKKASKHERHLEVLTSALVGIEEKTAELFHYMNSEFTFRLLQEKYRIQDSKTKINKETSFEVNELQSQKDSLSKRINKAKSLTSKHKDMTANQFNSMPIKQQVELKIAIGDNVGLSPEIKSLREKINKNLKDSVIHNLNLNREFAFSLNRFKSTALRSGAALQHQIELAISLHFNESSKEDLKKLRKDVMSVQEQIVLMKTSGDKLEGYETHFKEAKMKIGKISTHVSRNLKDWVAYLKEY